jgi:4-amino-4-deoxy-L-arabinose transferase-like glycosyltransferase
LLALLLVVFGAGRRLFGTTSAFFALVLVAFEPNVLAHAGIVHTDVAVTVFWLGFVLGWAGYLRRPTPLRLLAAGVLLGAALSTKYSAVYLLPTAILVSLGIRCLDRKEIARRLLRDLASLTGVLVVAAAVVAAISAPAVSGTRVADQQQTIRRALRDELRAPRISEQVASVSPWSRPLAQYLGGLAQVGLQSTSGRSVVFLDGRTSLTGFPGYFFVAFLVKTGPALLAAVALSIVLVSTRKLDSADAILWLPALYIFLFSIGSTYNIGVRHILPAYPFLALAGSRLVRDLGRLRGRLPKLALPVAAILGAAQLATAASAHPYELSYFNVFGGGMPGGYRVLSDSNVDWGLDLRRVADEIRRRGVANPTIAYFGGDSPAYRIGVPDFASDPRVRGSFVAISASLWDFGAPYYALHGRLDLANEVSKLIDRLRREGRPVGRIGGSTFLYELPAARP